MLTPPVQKRLKGQLYWRGKERIKARLTCDVQAAIVFPEALCLVGLAACDDLIALKAVVVLLPCGTAPNAHLIAPVARAVLLLAWDA